MALAHTISNKAEAAYRRSDLLEKRRDLMMTWSSSPRTKKTHEHRRSNEARGIAIRVDNGSHFLNRTPPCALLMARASLRARVMVSPSDVIRRGPASRRRPTTRKERRPGRSKRLWWGEPRALGRAGLTLPGLRDESTLSEATPVTTTTGR